jgi:hypothetical protein
MIQQNGDKLEAAVKGSFWSLEKGLGHENFFLASSGGQNLTLAA